jgi:hypothetical protein
MRIGLLGTFKANNPTHAWAFFVEEGESRGSRMLNRRQLSCGSFTCSLTIVETGSGTISAPCDWDVRESLCPLRSCELSEQLRVMWLSRQRTYFPSVSPVLCCSFQYRFVEEFSETKLLGQGLFKLKKQVKPHLGDPGTVILLFGFVDRPLQGGYCTNLESQTPMTKNIVRIKYTYNIQNYTAFHKRKRGVKEHIVKHGRNVSRWSDNTRGAQCLPLRPASARPIFPP